MSLVFNVSSAENAILDMLTSSRRNQAELCLYFNINFLLLVINLWPGRVVGIATGYWLDCPGSNPGGGEIFHTCPDRLWDPSSLLYNGYRVFPGGKERPGRSADPSPPSSAVIKKEESYTSTPSMGRTVCTER